MKLQSFSLLELMTVIFIISVLAVTAVPMYNTYVIRGHVASAFPIMTAYRDKAIQYYLDNGVFPTAQDLNLPTTGNDYTISSPQAINQYTSLQIINVDTANCNGLRGEISFNFDHTALNISQDFYITMLLRINNGIVVTTCGPNWDSTLSPAGSTSYMPVSCQTTNTNTC